ncbi:MAG: class I SAM-dependent methyltransferase [Candidatus Omnitrophota bacterium]
MIGLLRKAWWRVLLGQKNQWDSLAFSFLKSAPSVLDLGCGSGRFLALDPEKIKGIDWNEASIAQCKEQGYRVTCADLRKLPFDDRSFLGIHCSHVIEHFFPLDVYKILSEIDRVLAPQGMLVIRTPLMWSGFFSDLTHIRPYNPEAIMNYLIPSGQRTLKQISCSYKLVCLRWRYQPVKVKNVYLNEFFYGLNKWGFPWIKKNGYMLVLKKEK